MGEYVPPGDYWYELTAWEDQQTNTIGKPDDFSLKCEVTDYNGHNATDIHSVTVENNPSPPAKANYSENQKGLEKSIPTNYILGTNFPNPFNPVTKITFGLPEPNHVILNIYDVRGKLVSALINDFRESGYYTVEFNGKGLPSGLYFYQMKAGEFSSIKRMLLVK